MNWYQRVSDIGAIYREQEEAADFHKKSAALLNQIGLVAY
jgi:hypothetical protein